MITYNFINSQLWRKKLNTYLTKSISLTKSDVYFNTQYTRQSTT